VDDGGAARPSAGDFTGFGQTWLRSNAFFTNRDPSTEKNGHGRAGSGARAPVIQPPRQEGVTTIGIARSAGRAVSRVASLPPFALPPDSSSIQQVRGSAGLDEANEVAIC
jgi:hypothetical protein